MIPDSLIPGYHISRLVNLRLPYLELVVLDEGGSDGERLLNIGLGLGGERLELANDGDRLQIVLLIIKYLREKLWRP